MSDVQVTLKESKIEEIDELMEMAADVIEDTSVLKSRQRFVRFLVNLGMFHLRQTLKDYDSAR